MRLRDVFGITRGGIHELEMGLPPTLHWDRGLIDGALNIQMGSPYLISPSSAALFIQAPFSRH